MSYKTFEIINGSVVFADTAEKAETIKNMQAEDEFKEDEIRDMLGDNWGADDKTIMLDDEIYFD